MEERIKVPRFKKELGFETSPKRSKIMSKIRAKNPKAEVMLRKELWRRGYRYRTNWKKLPGTPDLVFNKYKLVVFVDGEFWHGKDWKIRKSRLKSNRDFWIPKIERNIQKDQEVNQELKDMKYKVLRFWENQIKKELDVCVKMLIQNIEERKTSLP